jgi:Mg-chelatase subunit ChlI
LILTIFLYSILNAFNRGVFDHLIATDESLEEAENPKSKNSKSTKSQSQKKKASKQDDDDEEEEAEEVEDKPKSKHGKKSSEAAAVANFLKGWCLLNDSKLRVHVCLLYHGGDFG